ncbi:MAG: hypothetical protein ACE5I7_18945 [Candidatus Binatia bacterium]
MANRGKRWERRKKMGAMLERWERSGLALSTFADREHVSRKTLYRWRRRLGVGGNRLRAGRRRTSGPARAGRSQWSATFTEVRAALHTASAVTFEVMFGDGTTVRVPEYVDRGSLRTLLETLRECCACRRRYVCSSPRARRT